MPPAEARGYIRVRAAGVVARELDRMLSRHRNSLARHRDRLVQLATQQLVAGLLADVTQPEPQARGHAELRNGLQFIDGTGFTGGSSALPPPNHSIRGLALPSVGSRGRPHTYRGCV